MRNRKYRTVRRAPSYSPTVIPELNRACDGCGHPMTWSVLGFPQCLACKRWGFWRDIGCEMADKPYLPSDTL